MTTLDDYCATLTPMLAGRVRKAMGLTFRRDTMPYIVRRSEIIEGYVAEGATITEHPGSQFPRRLSIGDGRFRDERQVTALGFGYAAFLIAARDLAEKGT